MPEYKYQEKMQTWWWGRGECRVFRYRFGPVPGITRSRRYFTGYRWPKTFQEIRSGYIADEDDSLSAAQIEKLTKVRDLPTVRDDVLRKDWRDKSWKRHRKTQHLSSERTLCS